MVFLPILEGFWVEKVQKYFDSQPFRLHLDTNSNVSSIIANLLEQAVTRERQVNGVRYQGPMMQHMVGAKLGLIMGAENISHNNSSTNDADNSRNGDFDLSGSVIHVTTSPSEALIRKCEQNLSVGRKPIVVTSRKGVQAAEIFAENQGIEKRVEIIDFVQFMSANVLEHGKFTLEGRNDYLQKLANLYNEIIDSVETDPSLRIELNDT